MAIIRPPKQGQAYAAPDGSNCCVVQHKLTALDCAVIPKGRSVDRTRCLMGPGIIEYTIEPGSCSVAIITGCTYSTYSRMMP